MSEFQKDHGRANQKLVGSSLCYQIADIRDDHRGLLANWLQVSCIQVTTMLSLQSSAIRSDGLKGYFVRLHFGAVATRGTHASTRSPAHNAYLFCKD